MKKWQKDRNYKRVKDKDGNVVAKHHYCVRTGCRGFGESVCGIFADGPAGAVCGRTAYGRT